MISIIERLDEPNVIIFKHIGMIQDGEEDTESDDVKSWAGALEKYMLFDSDNFSIRASFLDAFMKSSYSAKEIKPIFLSSGSIISEPMRLTADPKK